MPDRSTSDDVITRNTWILYYISKKGKVENNISKLSRELGYQDDSTVNKKINKLKEGGCLEEKGNILRLTRKGKRKILFLNLPKYLLLSLFVLSYIPIHDGIGEFLFDNPNYLQAWLLVLQGLVSFILVGVLYWAYRTGERQFFHIGRQIEED